jgi:Secretory lipase
MIQLARVRRLSAAALACALLGSACADTDTEPEAQPQEELATAESALVTCGDPTPDADFYKLSGALPSANGTLIKCERLATSPAGAQAYRVLYKTSSEIRTGTSVATVHLPASGQVVVPTAAPKRPDGSTMPLVGGKYDRPVIADTHGTTGIIASCGPSRLRIQDGYPVYLDGVMSGAVIVYPDFTGLGIDTPIRVSEASTAFTVTGGATVKPFTQVSHPYLSIEAEGRSTVDLVRAARELANLPANPRWISFGQSQGGHAAIAAAEVVARGYGSELRLLGVVAGAPAAELDTGSWWAPEFKNMLVSNFAGALPLEFRDLRASSWFTADGLRVFSEVPNRLCSTESNLLEIAARFTTVPRVFKVWPWEDPAGKAALGLISPGRAAVNVPMFVGVVRGDPIIAHQRVGTYVQKARLKSPGKITFCEYKGPADPALPATLRTQNHNAFGAMFNQPTPYYGCSHDGSAVQKSDPRSFVDALYRATF